MNPAATPGDGRGPNRVTTADAISSGGTASSGDTSSSLPMSSQSDSMNAMASLALVGSGAARATASQPQSRASSPAASIQTPASSFISPFTDAPASRSAILHRPEPGRPPLPPLRPSSRGGACTPILLRETPVNERECVVCPKSIELHSVPLFKGLRPPVEGLAQLFCCSEACKKVLNAARRNVGKGLVVMKSIVQWETGMLKTDVRVGDYAQVLGDDSKGSNIEKGFGNVIAMKLVQATRCASMDVTYVSSQRVARGPWPHHAVKRPRPDSPSSAAKESDVHDSGADSDGNVNGKLENFAVAAESQRKRALLSSGEARKEKRRRTAAETKASDAESKASAAQASIGHLPRYTFDCRTRFLPKPVLARLRSKLLMTNAALEKEPSRA